MALTKMEQPTIWYILDKNGNRLGETVQLTQDRAEADGRNRFSTKFGSVVDSGKKKPYNKCCNKCGDKPCG